MARKRYTAEQIIGMLREAEVRLGQGEKAAGIACQMAAMRDIRVSPCRPTLLTSGNVDARLGKNLLE